jgi:hypothetical protein
MGVKIFPGRYTARIEGKFVVFMIGARINQPWAVRKWLPVVQAMGPMVRYLRTHPELGLLHVEQFYTGSGVMLVQYWRSVEALMDFAHQTEHLVAWRNFNRAVGDNGSVGIWHETLVVESFEAIYANMPRIGLAQAGDHLPIRGRGETARDRLQGT